MMLTPGCGPEVLLVDPVQQLLQTPHTDLSRLLAADEYHHSLLNTAGQRGATRRGSDTLLAATKRHTLG